MVLAELAARFPSETELRKFLSETGIRLVRSSEKSAYVAGARWAAYAARKDRSSITCVACRKAFEIRCPDCGKADTPRLHVLADFLIGAHALTNADRLASRDLGIYKTYFGDLKVMGSVG